MTAIEQAVSFGEICDALGERDHRIRYALDKLDRQPIRRCGNALIWPAEMIEAVRAELGRIDARRSRQTGATV